mmetsp:Transcript_15492/g.43878  ORF Transcript_15492/g.43878 Transcript_15492/m.43878 type:complete len:522 (-) Transcript_15492:60-1625(-)
MVEAEGASACAKQVVIVGMPQLVLVGWYLALRRRSILRSRGLTLSSAIFGVGMISMMVVNLIPLFCPASKVHAIHLGVGLSLASLFCLLGLFFMLKSFFRMYHKLDSGANAQSFSSSGFTQSRHSSAKSDPDSASDEVTIMEETVENEPPTPVDGNDHTSMTSQNELLIRFLRNRRRVRLFLVPTGGVALFGWVVPFLIIPDDAFFMCAGMACWGPTLCWTLGICVVAGGPIMIVAFLANRYVKQSSRRFEYDSLGLKRHLQYLTKGILLVEASLLVGCLLYALGHLTMDMLFHVLNVGFVALFTIVIIVPIYFELRLKRLGAKPDISSQMVMLKSFLAKRDQRQLFKTHLQSEFASELIVFFEHVKRYKALFKRTPPPEDKIADLYKVIIDTFLLPSSPLEVNVTDAASRPFRTKVASRKHAVSPDGHVCGPSADVFDAALEEVLGLMAAEPLQRFELHPTYSPVWQEFVGKKDKIARTYAVIGEINELSPAPSPTEPCSIAHIRDVLGKAPRLHATRVG